MPLCPLGCTGVCLSSGARGDLGTSGSPAGASVQGRVVRPRAMSCFSAIHLLPVECCPLCISRYPLCISLCVAPFASAFEVSFLFKAPSPMQMRSGATETTAHPSQERRRVTVSCSPFLLLLLCRMLVPGMGEGRAGRGEAEEGSEPLQRGASCGQ